MNFTKTHGQSAHNRTKEYKAWVSMKQRCTNPKTPEYQNYGGRGITVCQEWLDSFVAFFDHIGAAPEDVRTWSVDRINNEGNYEPGNVRWATMKTQGRNRRCNHVVNYKGKNVTLSEACEDLGMNPTVILGRILIGHPFDEAIKMPNRKRGNKQWIEWEGERVSLAQLALRFNQHKDLVYMRMKRGWELKEALETPARPLRSRIGVAA
jgi:hypothetical protein